MNNEISITKDGAITQGDMLVDIDKSVKHVIIPANIKTVNPGISLDGIKCLELYDSTILRDLEGMPQKIVLNDEGLFQFNPVDIFGNVSKNRVEVLRYLGRHGLKYIEITNPNNLFVTVNGSIYTKDMTTLVKCPQGMKGELIIPEGVKFINEQACYRCEISSVVFPDSLEDIGMRAFAECRKLENISFGKGIKKIGGLEDLKIFDNCASLKSVEIPPQVKIIGNGVFQYSGLRNVVLHEGLEEIYCGAFASTLITEIHFPNSLRIIGDYNFPNVDDIYFNQPIKNLINAVGARSRISNSVYDDKVRTIALHIKDSVAYIPRGLNSITAAEDILYNRKELYWSLYKFSGYKYSQLDAAMFIYLNGARNAELVKYLRDHLDKIAVRLTLSGRTQHLVAFIQTGFFTIEELNHLLEILDKAEEHTSENIPVIRAYIMQMIGQSRKQESEDFTIN